MAEHTIQHNADAHRLGLGTKLLQLLIGAQDRIHLVIISCIIMMIAGGLKNRIQIDNRNPQILQIRQLLLNTCQIAAIEIIGNNLLGIHILVVKRLVIPASMVYSTLFLHQPIALAVESIWKNLVHNRVAEPIRRICPLVKHCNLVGLSWRIIPQIANTAHAGIIVAIVPDTAVYVDNKIIPQKAALLRHSNIGREIHLSAYRILWLQHIDQFSHPLPPESCLDGNLSLLILYIIQLQLDSKAHISVALCSTYRTTIKFIL